MVGYLCNSRTVYFNFLCLFIRYVTNCGLKCYIDPFYLFIYFLFLLLGLNRSAIRNGLFGYNGILVGAGLGTFLEGPYEWKPILFICLMALMAEVIQLALGNLLIPHWQMPPFTMPFNLVLFIGLLGAYQLQYVHLSPSFAGASTPVLEPAMINIQFETGEFFKGWMRGIAQVYLADSWVR